LKRLPGLCTKPSHPFVCIVTRERRQVHAGDGAQEPRRLPFFFNRAAGRVGLRSTLNRTGIDSHTVNLVKTERDTAIR
jgi:hypothetical protein